MQKFIFILIGLILLGNTSFATHILGGEMYYEFLGNNQYKITFKVYRDCDVALNPYEDPAEVNVFDQSNGAFTNSVEQFPLVDIEDLNLVSAIACDSAPNSACYRLLIYEKILTLPPTQGGYYISYTRCCRTGMISNLSNGLNEGLTVGTTIPGTASGIGQNSSPIIGPEPEIFLCVDQPIDFDLAALDPDGDSLVYELVNPLSGTYDPNLPPPYPNVSFGTGYTATQPLGVSSSVNLDPITGVLSMLPTQQGMFQFGLKVTEYRNGQLVGTTIRDFFFIVRVCSSLSFQAEMRLQENLNDFESYCQGLTINFVNLSDFGSYLWDFGVPGTVNDTSSLESPSFTYPESGIYEVQLVLNPGLQCADTAAAQFKVFTLPDLDILSDSIQCLDGNNFNFEVVGTPNDSSVFNWEFGSDASIATAVGTEVLGISYASSGMKPLILYYADNYCADTLYDTVQVQGASQINLSFTKPDEIACAPYEVQFENLSTASTAVNYYWDFGNGQFSNLTNPTTQFISPGVYDITLFGISNDGCSDTIEIEYANYVEVFPSPTAGIDADRNMVSPYDPLVEFYNLSINFDSVLFFVEDQVSSQDPHLHTFVNSGIQFPYIVAYNNFGCTDTARIQIDVDGEETIFIPNAFTPNGDGRNDVFRLNLFDLKEFEFRIFNRTGQLLFETQNTQAIWDGTFKGQKVPDGVYPFRLRYLDLQNLPKVIEGTITLIQ